MLFRSARRRLTHHPKFFLFDTGVFRALRPTGPLDQPAEIDGAALETMFFQQVCAELDWRDPRAEIFYWRTATGLEVDFVVYSENIFAAIEIKRKRTVTRNDLRGMKAFARDYPQVRKLLFYGGDHKEIIDGVEVLPLQSSLARLGDILME